MLPLLNPTISTTREACGFIPPLIRSAMHIGFDIAWVAATTDEQWELRDSSVHANREKVRLDLIEVKEHLDPMNLPDYGAFVNEDAVQAFDAIHNQASDLLDDMSYVRSDVLDDLRIFANNLAYVSVVFERHVTGSEFAVEGLNA